MGVGCGGGGVSNLQQECLENPEGPGALPPWVASPALFIPPPPKNLVLLSVSALKTLGAGRFPNDTLFTDYTVCTALGMWYQVPTAFGAVLKNLF